MCLAKLLYQQYLSILSPYHLSLYTISNILFTFFLFMYISFLLSQLNQWKNLKVLAKRLKEKHQKKGKVLLRVYQCI